MASSISNRLRELQQDKPKPKPTPTPTPAANEDTRKARTHRLVQLGALAEQYLGVKGIEPVEFEKFIAELARLPEADAYIQNHRRSS